MARHEAGLLYWEKVMPPEPKGTSGDIGDLIGVKLFRPDGTFAGRLVQDPDKGLILKNEFGFAKFQGGTYLLEAGFAVTVNAQGDIITKEALDTGTGTTASFASTQAAQTQMEAFQREQDRLNREFQEEQNRLAIEARAEEARLAEEAAVKRGRLSTLTDLIQSFVGAQAQARDTLANLQPDPFRFAAVAGGIAPFGTTPQQGFQTQLQEFAAAPAPVADPNASLPSIESAIQGLTGASVPLSPGTFGAAEGVVIEMSKGADGSYSAVPLPFDVQARLVGENPDGTVNKTTEVMVTSSRGTAIIPLGKGAQDGGFFPFQPIEFDKETLLPALSTSGIFSDFGRVPFAQFGRKFGGTGQQRFVRGIFEGRPGERGSARNPLGANPFQASTLSKLGLAPGLVRFGGENTVYFRDPLTGELRPFSGAEQFGEAGFSMGNVVSVREQDRGTFEFGDVLGPNFDPSQSAGTQGVSPFTKFAAPIIEPTTGTLLPAPFAVAEQLNRLRLTNPTLFNLMLSAYKSAGQPVESVLSSIQQSLPFGQQRGTIGLR
jgi:hypothetical protein